MFGGSGLHLSAEATIQRSRLRHRLKVQFIPQVAAEFPVLSLNSRLIP